MSDFSLLAGFFLFVMTGVALAGYAFWERTEKASGEPIAGNPGLAGAQNLLAQAFRRVGETVPAAKAESNPMRNLLLSAGYRLPSAVPIVYGVKCGCAFVLATVLGGASALTGGEFTSVMIGSLCCAAFGFQLPEFVLKRMIRARAARIRRAVPVALDLLTLSLEAGQSLNQAIVYTSQELRQAHPDLSDELSQVNLQLRAGKSRAEALHQLGARSGDPELKKLASLLVDSDRFGTTLGPALRTHAKYLRTRMRQGAQESARKVSVKLVFPVFFLIFPSVLLVTLGPAVFHMFKQFADIMK